MFLLGGYLNCKDNSQFFGPLKYGSDMSILDKSLNSYSPKLTLPSRMAIMSLFFNNLLITYS